MCGNELGSKLSASVDSVFVHSFRGRETAIHDRVTTGGCHECVSQLLKMVHFVVYVYVEYGSKPFGAAGILENDPPPSPHQWDGLEGGDFLLI